MYQTAFQKGVSFEITKRLFSFALSIACVLAFYAPFFSCCEIVFFFCFHLDWSFFAKLAIGESFLLAMIQLQSKRSRCLMEMHQ